MYIFRDMHLCNKSSYKTCFLVTNNSSSPDNTFSEQQHPRPADIICLVQAYHGKFQQNIWLSIAILNSNLLQATMHHPTKIQADNWNPLKVKAVTSSLRPDALCITWSRVLSENMWQVCIFFRGKLNVIVKVSCRDIKANFLSKWGRHSCEKYHNTRIVPEVDRCHLHRAHAGPVLKFTYGSGHGTAAVLLPGFAINW